MKLSQFAVAVAVAVMCCLGVAHAANYNLWEDETVPVSYEMDGPSLESSYLRVYTMPNCAPCEAWKRDVWPKLQAKGWEEGRNVEFVTVAENAPRFEWVTDRGTETVQEGYHGRDAFNAWHRAAVDGPAKVSAGVCQCGEDCPCRASVTSERVIRTDRTPPENFVFTEIVEPTAVFTEYDEPQGVLDPAYQVSYESPQVVQRVAYQSGNCASGMCGPAQAVQSYGYQMGNCASGQCGPMQAMPAQQHAQGYWTPPAQSHSHQGAARRGPVRRIVGGLFGGFCR